jgi:hypothetical protein
MKDRQTTLNSEIDSVNPLTNLPSIVNAAALETSIGNKVDKIEDRTIKEEKGEDRPKSHLN